MRKIGAFFFLIVAAATLAFGVDIDRLDKPTELFQWKYAPGDDPARADPAFDDATWKRIAPGDRVSVDASGYVWLRTEFAPSEALRGSRLYAFLGKFPCPSEFYVNGSLVATRGSYPPDYYVPISDPVDFLVPEGLLAHGARNVLAVRAAYRGSSFPLPRATIGGDAAIAFEKDVSELFNTRLYYVFAAINLFAGMFFVLQFLYRRKETSALLFAVTSILMALYFYEMGSPHMAVDAWIMRPLSKAALGMSVAFFLLFCVKYFGLHDNAVLKAVNLAVSGAFALWILVSPDETALLSRFQIMLGVVMASILFSLYVIVRATIRGDSNAIPILVGALVAITLSIYDIIYNFMGLEPFAWLEGIGFFAMDVSLFVSLAIRSAKAFNALEDYSIQIEAKKDELFRTNSAFSRFVPQEFLRFLGKESILEIKLGDQVLKEMTILFSDIRSFTSMSETMSPAENFTFINSYLSRIVPVVRERKGIVDKYVGDALMSLFPEAPENAIDAAIEMRKVLRLYNEGRVRAGYPAIDTGIGIHSGSLMLGTIGEPHRMDTTVISDVVNVASRLESLTKVFRVPILASGQTIDKIPKARERYEIRYLGRAAVRGKSSAVPIYEIIDDPELAENKPKIALKTRFERAVALYDSGDHLGALREFRDLAAKSPKDPALRYYIDLITRPVEPEIGSTIDE